MGLKGEILKLSKSISPKLTFKRFESIHPETHTYQIIRAQQKKTPKAA